MAKKKQYNKGQLGKAHAFKQTFFETKGHPCRTKQERPHSVKLRLAFNEKRMFEGIANSLKSTTTMALRIALFEYHRFYQRKGVLHDQPDHVGRNFGQAPVNGYGRRQIFFTLTMSDAEAELLNTLCIDANAEMAETLVNFLTSPEIQELIGKYGVKDYGMQLFTPCAGAEPKS